MNILIIYSSKYGSTADCAKYLKAGFSGSVVLLDINRTNPQLIDWEKYDTVIVGSSIYVGKAAKKIRTLCSDYNDLLCTKRVGIFLCCALPEKSNEYLSPNFPTELLKSALVIKSFGGEARLDKMKVVDKIIMKAATKGHYENLKISKEGMDTFIEQMSS